MRILKSIENALSKAKESRRSATLRQDVVRRAVERGEFKGIRCAFYYTDDYVWDEVNNYGRGEVSGATILNKYNIIRPSCWVDKKTVNVRGVECYEISIMFHSNLSYDMYVPVSVAKSA